MKLTKKLPIIFLFLLPIISIFVAYWPIYHAPFILDDQTFLIEWPILHSWKGVPLILKGSLPEGHEGGYRPLRTLHEALSYQLFGENASLYHIQGVIIHIGSSIFVLLILRRLFALFSPSQKKSSMLLAELGAIVFALHPIATESVAFIQASFDTMGITFAFISYFIFLQLLDRTPRQFKYKLYFFLSSFFAAVAFLYYELAYTLPAFIFITTFLFFHQTDSVGKSIKKAFVLSAVTFVFLIILLLLRTVILQLPTGRPSYSPGAYFTFLASTRSLFLYYVQTIFPVQLHVGHQIAPGLTTFGIESTYYKKLQITDLQTILALLGTGTLLFLAFKLRRKAPLFCLGSVWFLVGLTPILNILVQGTIFSERYLYFSLFGFCLMIISGLAAFVGKIKTEANKRNIILGLMILFGIPYGMRTFFRTIDWTNPIYFWQKEIQHIPNIAFFHNSLGLSYFADKQLDKALEEFGIAHKIHPVNPDYLHNASIVLIAKKNYPEARVYAEEAVQIKPYKEKIFNNLQKINKILDDPEHALTFYTELAKQDRPTSDMYFLMGNLSLRLGQTATAEASFRKAIDLKPNFEEPYINLAALLNSLNRPLEARDILEKANTNGSKNANLYYNLAVSYMMLKENPKAKMAIEKAFTINPNDVSIQKFRDQLEL